MKVFPSTSRTVAPFARSMNSGVPPTERKARTGEFTPPGISVFASANSLLEVFVFSGATGASCLLEGGVDRGRAEIVPTPPPAVSRKSVGNPGVLPETQNGIMERLDRMGME